jgi:hypothetical protein
MRSMLFTVVLIVAGCSKEAPKPKTEPMPPPAAAIDATVTPPSTPPPDAPAPAEPDAAEATGDDGHHHEHTDAFLAKSKDDKLAIMKTQVMPAMSKAFKAFDGKEFAKFNCRTCHGKGATDKTFEMPNPDLPVLDFAKLKAGKDHPKTAKFMADVVVPEMAKLLELEPATDKNPDGFGCLHCHTAKQ